MRFEDLETEEDIFWFYVEALNPVTYFDYRNYSTAERRGEKAEKAVLASVIYGSAAAGAHAFTGGGAHNLYNLVNATRPGAMHVWAAKQHIVKTVATGALHAVKKSAFPFTVMGMYAGVRGYFHHLARLDWVPDLYQV